MASTDTPVGAAAAIYLAVQTLTNQIDVFKDQQVAVFTSQAATTVVTDSNGNPVTIPTWYAATQNVQQNVLNLATINTEITTLNSEVSALQTQVAGLGGGGGALAVWNGAASEITATPKLLPYGFHYFMRPDQLSQLYDFTIDTTGTIATYDDTNRQYTTGLFKFSGLVPSVSDSYWFVLASNVTAANGNILNLGFVVDAKYFPDNDAINFSAGKDCQIYATIMGGSFHLYTNLPSNWTVTATANTLGDNPNILVLVDPANNQISFLNAAAASYSLGLLATAVYTPETYYDQNNNLVTTTSISGMAILGSLYANSVSTINTVTLEAVTYTGTLPMPAIVPGLGTPVTYTPMQVVSAVLPTGHAVGTPVMSSTQTSYIGQQIAQDEIFFDTGEGLVPIYTKDQVAVLSRSNTFTASQVVQPHPVKTSSDYYVIGTLVIDCDITNNFQYALTGNLTVSAPLHPKLGQSIVLCLDMANAGGWVITFDPVFAWANNVVPTINTAAGAKNTFRFYYDGSYWRS